MIEHPSISERMFGGGYDRGAGGSARCVQAKQSTVDFRLVALFHFEMRGHMSQANGNPATSKNVVHWPVKFLIGLFAGYVRVLAAVGRHSDDRHRPSHRLSERVCIRRRGVWVLVGGVMMIPNTESPDLQGNVPRRARRARIDSRRPEPASNTNELKDVVRQQSTLTQAWSPARYSNSAGGKCAASAGKTADTRRRELARVDPGWPCVRR